MSWWKFSRSSEEEDQKVAEDEDRNVKRLKKAESEHISFHHKVINDTIDQTIRADVATSTLSALLDYVEAKKR